MNRLCDICASPAKTIFCEPYNCYHVCHSCYEELCEMEIQKYKNSVSNRDKLTQVLLPFWFIGLIVAICLIWEWWTR